MSKTTKRIISAIIGIAMLFSAAVPVGAIPLGNVALVPGNFWPVFVPYEQALERQDSAAIVYHGRRVIEFWLGGVSAQERAAQLSQNIYGNGAIINYLWSTAYTVVTHAAGIGDRANELWATGVALAVLDLYQALIPLTPHIWGDPADMEFSRTLLTNRLSVLEATAVLFAEVTGGTGRTVYHGALHEPRTGVIFGEQMGYKAIMDGPQRPSGLTIYAEFEICHLPTRVLSDLATHESDHGVSRYDLQLIQVAWNFYYMGHTPRTVAGREAMIIEAAQFLYGTGLPVLLRVGGEVDVWTTVADPDEFINAFRFIANIMRRYAPNVAMVYSVNFVSAVGIDWMTYFPGDEYVDWVGVSLYTLRYFMGDPNVAERDEIIYRTGRFANPVAVIRELVEMFGDRMPLLVSEGAVALHNASNREDTTEWALPVIRQKYSYIPMLFPEVKAMFWFNVHRDDEAQFYDFNQSPRARALYSELTGSPKFLSGNRTYSPITFREVSGSFARMPANNVTLLTYAPFFSIDNVSVRYILNGRQIGVAHDVPYRMNFDLSGEADGTHSLRVEVFSGPNILETMDFHLLIGNQTAIVRCVTAHAPGEVIGNVYHTDIRVFIDDVELPAFNIGGTTVVDVELLRAYGFNVGWSGAYFALTVARGQSTETPPHVPPNTMSPGTIYASIHHSEVITIIDGRPVQSYDLLGTITVPIRDIAAPFGTLMWCGDTREVRVQLR